MAIWPKCVFIVQKLILIIEFFKNFKKGRFLGKIGLLHIASFEKFLKDLNIPRNLVFDNFLKEGHCSNLYAKKSNIHLTPTKKMPNK